MDNSIDPFSPNTPLTRELLERYALDKLTPEERHAVELHLENDPLLHDAVEGLGMSGAVEGLHTMHRPRLSGMGNGAYLALGAVLVVGGIALWSALHNSTIPSTPTVPVASTDVHVPAVIPAAVESTLLVVHAELDALPKRTGNVPEGRDELDRFHQPAESPEQTERTAIERMEGTPVKLDRASGISAPAVKRATKPSRRLLYLHGLKVVHPDEMDRDRRAPLRSPGVPANAEPMRRDSIPSGPTAIPYLTLLDEALGAFSRGEEGVALDDLYFLLGQYPDDVNAQFYGGLACYRLGLYPRALRLLQAAAENPVDSFREEALWYEALTTVKQNGRAAARPALERIANSGGFYATQAQVLLEAR